MANKLTELTETDKQLLKNKTPYALPDNPSNKGLSASQIKAKMYEGQLQNFEFIKRVVDETNTAFDLFDSYFTNGVAKKATADANGNTITTTYATKTELATKQNSFHANNVRGYSSLVNAQSDLSNLIENQIVAVKEGTTFSFFIKDGNNLYTYDIDKSDKTDKDANGNIIDATYATIANLAVTNAEITKIKNGGTIANKAYNDQDGNPIKSTYIKIANIINNLTSTDTDKPLSAYQGKQLKAMIDNINTILGSNDTDLDTLQELVNWIHDHEDDYTALTTGKINYTDIITNYTSNVDNKPVSASVAYALKGLIDNLVNGTTKAKKAEIADKLGNTTESQLVKTVNGVAPVNGDVNASGTISVDAYNQDTGKININSTGLTMSYDESTGILTVI